MDINRILLIGLCCMGVQNAFAEVYKWVDENDRVQFSDRPHVSKQTTNETDKKTDSTGKSINEVSKESSVQPVQIDTNSNRQAYPDSIILKLRQLLQQKKFDELNLILDGYQTASESNSLAEDSLFTAYDAFDTKDMSYGPLLHAWVKATPGSYQPYLARAKHYYRLGWASRGGKWASETKKEQFEKMKTYFSKAVKDLDTVLKINKQSMVPYYLLIGIANAQGKGGCSFRVRSVSNGNEQEEIVQEFKSEFESKKKECVLLVVYSTSAAGKWTIAGFNDEMLFKRELIDDPTRELSLEEKKKSATKSKIVELITSKLGRTPKDDKAATAVRKALKINPASYQLRARYLKFIAPRWGGSIEQMQAFIKESLVHLSENSKLKYLEGYPYAEAGDMQATIKKYSTAEKLYTKALSYGENHAILKERGENSYRQENYKNALNDLNRAIVLYPEEGKYYYWRSKTYSMLQQYSKALTDIERASQLEPDDEYIQKQRKWLVSKFTRQGYELNKSRKPAAAVEQYNAALRLDPNDAALYYRKARAFIDQNQLDSALSDLKRAIELDPNDFNYYQLLDWVLAKRKDWDQIIKYWDQYIALNPDNSRAYVERGGAYYRRGDMRSAVSNAKIAADMGNLEGKETYEKFRHRVR